MTKEELEWGQGPVSWGSGRGIVKTNLDKVAREGEDIECKT